MGRKKAYIIHLWGNNVTGYTPRARGRRATSASDGGCGGRKGGILSLSANEIVRFAIRLTCTLVVYCKRERCSNQFGVTPKCGTIFVFVDIRVQTLS